MKKSLTLIFLLCSIVSFAQNTGTITDTRDGKVYKTVVIGNQTWMAENLNVSTFRNGDIIPEAKTEEEWLKAGKEGRPVWCYFNNDPMVGNKYGKLYNWYAVIDKRGLAPKGWHITSSWEWSELVENLGGKQVSNEMSQMRYLDINSTKFNFTSGGSRNSNGDGKFDNPKEDDLWWNSSTYSDSYGYNGFAKFISMLESDNLKYNINLNFYVSDSQGMSVRCLKD